MCLCRMVSLAVKRYYFDNHFVKPRKATIKVSGHEYENSIPADVAAMVQKLGKAVPEYTTDGEKAAQALGDAMSAMVTAKPELVGLKLLFKDNPSLAHFLLDNGCQFRFLSDEQVQWVLTALSSDEGKAHWGKCKNNSKLSGFGCFGLMMNESVPPAPGLKSKDIIYKRIDRDNVSLHMKRQSNNYTFLLGIGLPGMRQMDVLNLPTQPAPLSVDDDGDDAEVVELEGLAGKGPVQVDDSEDESEQPLSERARPAKKLARKGGSVSPAAVGRGKAGSKRLRDGVAEADKLVKKKTRRAIINDSDADGSDDDDGGKQGDGAESSKQAAKRAEQEDAAAAAAEMVPDGQVVLSDELAELKKSVRQVQIDLSSEVADMKDDHASKLSNIQLELNTIKNTLSQLLKMLGGGWVMKWTPQEDEQQK